MSATKHLWNCLIASRAARDEKGAQLVEFALALPLLVVFVVGIFDFSSAFTLKQKLTNVARDAARIAAADPANDLTSPSGALPASVADAYQVVDNYLVANKINDCGITNSATFTSPATWKFAAGGSGCTGSGLTITINRSYYFPANVGAQPATIDCLPQAPNGQTAAVATCVSIQYAYPWRFAQAASLLGATATLPTTITATSVALNEN